MRKLPAGLLLVVALSAQAPGPRPFQVVRLDPALDAIVSTDAKIEILGEHFGLTEGPVWINDAAGGDRIGAMPLSRHFLGWDAPPLDRAVEIGRAHV